MQRKSVMDLDCANLFEDAIGPGHGLRPAEVDMLSERIEEYTADIRKRRGEDIGFMELPYDTRLADEIESKGRELAGWCKNFVVLGIGGSALGNITIQNALSPSFGGRPAGSGGKTRIIVLDNIDPALMRDFVEFVGPDLPETAFNVITKSGSTAETMSQFLHVRDLLRRTDGCSPEQQMILTTDPDPAKSLLRRLGEKDGYCMFPIPANVGGRFSVLSAVGLLSAAVGGVDVRELMEGAAAMESRCCSDVMYDNPAALYACALFKHYENGKPITVMMPYSHRLGALALWYCQLWAESLGKRNGLEKKDIFTGPTPIASVGVTDQHSVMQLYQDGPFDKVITFVEVDRCGEEGVPICGSAGVEPQLQYLSGKSFNDLFQAELVATRCALRDKHRPNCTLRLPEVSARTLGELFMFFQYAVTYSGYLYGVDAFDQPGVELGKQYTYGLMGREGCNPPRLS